MKLSLIIPVCNVEPYIRKCLESVCAQTFTDFEVILIDDGSQDACGQICDEYCKKDHRFHVIHKKNEGLMAAWIDGLKQSKGAYIYFLDSDDWIGEKSLEILMEQLENYHADIVVANYRSVAPDGKEERFHIHFQDGYYNREAIKGKIYPKLLNAGGFQERGLPISRWGKVIKRELLLRNLKYCDTRISYMEDVNIMFPVFLDCESLVIHSDPLCDYYYRMNPNSILRSYNKKMFFHVQLVFPILFQCAKDSGYPEMKKQINADYTAAIVQCYKNELMNPKGIKEAKKNIADIISNESCMKAVSNINASSYPILNRLIIFVLLHWNFWTRNIITYILFRLKRLKIKR